MRSLRVLGVGCVVAGLVIATPTLASAATPAPPAPVTQTDLVAAPFNIALDAHRVLVADGGTGQIDALQPDGSLSAVVQGVPGASGVAVRGAWLAYTSTVTNEATFENTASGLNIRTPNGATIYADTTAYEAQNNPDQVNTYGGEAGTCLADILGGPYAGMLDSHAYSVTSFQGGWVVADAGANDILAVDDSGNISTVAVLPAQPLVVTADMAAGLGLPDCTIGATYSFEPVPTDVAGGHDCMLYVTTLPGGPEGPELGARGSVWQVDPSTHAVQLVATGFLGATNLAIGKKGELYVAELFGGRVAVVQNGVTSTFASLPGVVAVQTTSNGQVWAATMAGDPSQPGTIVSITNGKVHIEGKVH
jgi:hypothetical protein